jgi:HEAT repeat protein
VARLLEDLLSEGGASAELERAAAVSLASIGPPPASVPLLQRLLKLEEVNPGVARPAVIALRKIGRPAQRALPDLSAAARAHPRLRPEIARAVGAIGPGPRSLELLRGFLGSDDPTLRAAAAYSLGTWDGEAAPALAELSRLASRRSSARDVVAAREAARRIRAAAERSRH